MDSNSNQTAANDVSDFLEMNALASGGGPINLLPNEIMQKILVKLRLDGDAIKLIRLRSVSTKWRTLVEDYFRLKKSLIVHVRLHPFEEYSFTNYNTYVNETFFGFTNSSNFVYLLLKHEVASKCLSSLLTMFPNIEQLTICRHVPWHIIIISEETLLSILADYINSLDSLKQLDLLGPFVPLVQHLSPALSKLEHFSYQYSDDYPKKNDHIKLISHLGPSCVRVRFGTPFMYTAFLQWHSINPRWLTNLTHLRIFIETDVQNENDELPQVVHFLSEHATSLVHLNIVDWDKTLKLSPSVINDLSKLTHLTVLKLGYIGIKLSDLEQAIAQHGLTLLSSVLTGKLYVHLVNDGSKWKIYADRVTRVLSIIFPNLVDLDLAICMRYFFDEELAEFLRGTEQNLNRFPNLTTHKFDFVSPIFNIYSIVSF